MGGVNAPAERNYAQETAETLKTQLALAPEKYAAEAKYAPQYQKLQLDLLRSATPELLQLYRDQISPAMSEAEAASRSRARAGDIADIGTLGPQARAAIKAASPQQAALADSLTAQAQSGLNAGSRLTPEQQRQVEQQTRGSFAARGLAGSPTAGLQEAVRSQLSGAGMQQQRSQQAMGALGASQGVYGDVFQQVLGRPSQAFGAGQGFIGQAQGFNPGQLFNPESQYAANLIGGNQQATLAARTATAANTSSMIGAGLSAL
jgi:hypothetical protein